LWKIDFESCCKECDVLLFCVLFSSGVYPVTLVMNTNAMATNDQVQPVSQPDPALPQPDTQPDQTDSQIQQVNNSGDASTISVTPSKLGEITLIETSVSGDAPLSINNNGNSLTPSEVSEATSVLATESSKLKAEGKGDN